MCKKITILLSLLFLLKCAPAAAAPVVYENRLIEKIDIVINAPTGAGCDESQVRAMMKTKSGDYFSQNDFDNDLKNLSQEFDKIDPSIQVIEGRLFITVKVWPKPVIRSITFEGNTRCKTKKLQKELGICTLSVFDRKAFNEAFHKLKTYYVKKGYFEAELNYDIKFDPCTNEVDIVVTICEGRSGRIKAINFIGFDSCEEEAILSKMVTKEYNIFLSWLNDEGTYREEVMQHDEFQILSYLQNEGYADAKVKINVEEVSANRINIDIVADKGLLYRVSRIKFSGNKLYSDDEIYSVFKIRPGHPYSPEKIRETTQAIQDLYGRCGYIDAYADFQPLMDSNCTYSIEIHIDEGEQWRVGLLKVFGNCMTETSVILHETLLVPGEVFNSVKLRLTEERLNNIGFFKKVNVYWVKSEDTCLGGRYRDVHIEVEETSTGKIGLFGGFSTSDSLFGGLSITENNFSHKGFVNAWNGGMRTFKGGGEYINLAGQWGLKSRTYELSWTKPYFLDTDWSIGFDADYSDNRYITKAYEITAVGCDVRAGYQINPFVRFQWHQRVRDSHVMVNKSRIIKDSLTEAQLLGYDPNAPKDQIPNPLPTPPTDAQLWQMVVDQDPSLARIDKNDGTVAAQGVTLTYDSTDSIKCPRSGYKSQFDFELAGMWGDYTFMGFAYLNTYYYKLCDKCTLKFRWDFRFICPFRNTSYRSLPLDERLYMGGNSLVRGYKPYKLGPVYRGTHIPEGGISQQLYSAEYNYNFSKKVDGFLFLDGGHLSKKYWDVTSNRVRWAYGIGMRLELLASLPPISFGFGFPINPKRHDRKMFFIQFGVKF